MASEPRGTKLITRVVVYYRRPDEKEEQHITLESTRGGGGIDGLAWNRPLVEKLAYRENGKYVDPRKGQDPGDWKLTTSETETTSLTDDGDCLWVHNFDCSWWKCCSDS